MRISSFIYYSIINVRKMNNNKRKRGCVLRNDELLKCFDELSDSSSSDDGEFSNYNISNSDDDSESSDGK